MRNYHKVILLLSTCFCIPAYAHAGFVDRMLENNVNQSAVFSVIFICQVMFILAVCLLLRKTRLILAVKDWCRNVSGKWFGVFIFATLLAFVCEPYLEFAYVYLWFFALIPVCLGYLLYVLCMLSRLRVSWKLIYGAIPLLIGQVAGYIVYLAIHGFKFFQDIFKYVEGGVDDEPVFMECLPDSRVVLEHLETAMGFFVLFVAPVLFFTIIHQVHVWRKRKKQSRKIAQETID